MPKGKKMPMSKKDMPKGMSHKGMGYKKGGKK